jgi:3-deoxy-D-manno-octulosonic-acid transferase
VAALIAWLRGLRDPARRERLADRFGRPQFALTQPVLWIHAASMGEVQAGAALVRQLLTRYPNYQIVMTTMTTTGAARVKSLFPERVTHCYLPYDLPFAVRGFLNRAQPQLAVILETELWPNLLRECQRRQIPVVVASARISPRTANWYRRLASLFRDVLGDGVLIAAQTTVDAERFKLLGAVNVQVIGNIKFDIEIPDQVRMVGAELRKQFGERFVWVAGSTHAGEEEAVIEAHRKLLEQRPDALLIMVPRHPQRFDEVRGALSKSELRFVSRACGAAVTNDVSVLLIDTMGELLNFYACADVAFVGGSLVPVGGHNLLEPAALGVPILCGPHMFATQDIADQMREAGGLAQVLSAQNLIDEVLRLATDAPLRQQLATRASAVVLANRGALSRTMEIVARTTKR